MSPCSANFKTPPEGVAPLESHPSGADVCLQFLEERHQRVPKPLTRIGLTGALYGAIHMQDNSARLIAALLLAHFCTDMYVAEHVE